MGELKNITGQKTNEAQEKALALCERYCIVSDNDGHDYVIKVWQTNEFYQWVEDPGYGDWKGHDFNEDRVEGGLTFTDPKVGHE